MSIESVRQFSQIAEDDPEIQKSLKATTEPKRLINLAIQLGSERGFSFTANEVEEYYTEARREAQGGIPKIGARAFSPLNAEDPDPCSGLPFLARQLCLKELNQ